MKLLLKYLLISIIVSCSNREPKKSLIEKWSGFENVNSYNEVWFTDSLLLEWNVEMYSHIVYSYNYDSENNRIIVMNPTNEVLNSIDINFINSDSIILHDSKNVWTYSRLESRMPDLSENRIDIIDFEIGMREKKARH